MPELPEVETIRRGLLPQVTGKPLQDVVVGDPHVLQTDLDELVRCLAGHSFRDIGRRGKFLIFELDDHQLIIHLGMTGQLTFRDPSLQDSGRFIRHPATGLQRIRQHAPDKHTHLQFLFQDGSAMLYRDIRKFGKIYLYDRQSDGLEQRLGHLGLEPLSGDYAWKPFRERLSRHRLRVKSLLLDQRFVAGVGNIYADEALFEARIHPERTVDSLSAREQKRLFEAVPMVLQRGLHFGGTSLRDYVNSDGEQGTHQEELTVYGRAGQPCPRCGREIVRIVVSQRGTHFCPNCQPLKRGFHAKTQRRKARR